MEVGVAESTRLLMIRGKGGRGESPVLARKKEKAPSKGLWAQRDYGLRQLSFFSQRPAKSDCVTLLA